MKWRNSKERELLSHGGSREQTLPTKNNPNPDLTDVGDLIAGGGPGMVGGQRTASRTESNTDSDHYSIKSDN